MGVVSPERLVRITSPRFTEARSMAPYVAYAKEAQACCFALQSIRVLDVLALCLRERPRNGAEGTVSVATSFLEAPSLWELSPWVPMQAEVFL